MKPKPAHIDSPPDWFASAGADRREVLSSLVKLCRHEKVEAPDSRTWNAIARSARAHGLLNLITPQLAAIGSAEEAAGLQEGLRYSAQRNLLLISETLRIAAAFATAGIEAAVFKGCLLSQLAHGASHLRQVLDLDFVVHPRDLAATVEVLKSCGYFLDHAWTPAIREGHFEYDCECCFFNGDRKTCVDLHWNFTPQNYGLPLKIDAFFTRLQTVPLHGREVRTFGPEDQILALCLHGAKHYWQKLEWIYTIAALIRNQPALDLEAVLNRAEMLGLRHIVASGFILAQHLFLAPLPAPVAERVNQNPAALEMARIAMRWVTEAPNGSPAPMQIRRFHSLGRVTWRAKLLYWFGVVATPTERDYSRPLPQVLHPLYFVLRLGRLLYEAIVPARLALGQPAGAPVPQTKIRAAAP